MAALLITARASARTQDLSITIRAGASAGDLLDAVAERLGVRSDPGLTVTGQVERTGGELDRSASAAECGLRTGDVVVLHTRPSVAGSGRHAVPTGALLLVIGGPLAGQSHPLRPGANTVGRSAGCSIALPDGSISRHHVTVHVGAQIVVEDSGSTHGTLLGGELLTTPRPVGPDTIIEIGNSVLRVDRAGAAGAATDSGLVIFNRPPRVDRPYEGRTFEAPPPPTRPSVWPIPIITAAAPLLMSAVMWAVTGMAITLLFGLLSPVMLIGSAIESRRSGRIEFQRQTENWRKKLGKVLDQASAELQLETAKRRSQTPDAPAIIARSRDLLPSLYERCPDDSDFLRLRVGTADLPSLNTIKVHDGGDDDLRDELDGYLGAFATVPAVPTTVSLVDHGSVGVSGDPEAALAVVRWLLIQAVTLHSPAELNVAVLAGPRGAARWSWVRWLPHLRSVRSRLPFPPIGGSSTRVEGLLEALLEEVAEREADGEQASTPALLVVVDDDLELPRHRLRELFERGPAAGVHVLWAGERGEQIPYLCGAVVEVAPDRRLVRIDSSTDGTTLISSLEGLAPDIAEACARQLAPVVDNQWPLSADSGVPSSMALVELLGGSGSLVDSLEIERRWERHRSGLRAPIGSTGQGEVSIDLRTDGPHGLVAGTTGSGKSELLQSMVVGIAATHPPSRVCFVLIDYKGGAAFKACKDLPHTVGFVTDLNEHLVRRALVSLNAELTRREHLLDAADAKDLVDMERKAPASAPPSLLIVVDEFAALAKEVPEFVEGVIDIAARGRSLGMHLVLATQRPAGVITDNIRANTNLRIALRVASPAESADVIGTKVAAGIDGSIPGRAYLQVGRNEPLAFQAGYVGGHTEVGQVLRPVEVADLEFEAIVAPDRMETARSSPGTDLEALVARIDEAAIGLPPARSPWLDPLPNLLDLLEGPADPDDGRLAIGIADRPAQQRQDPFSLDLDQEGSLLVYGTGGSGKSQVLRTLAVAAARAAGPDRLVITGIDYASGSLAALRDLPQVDGVLGPADGEQVNRLLRGLARRISARKEQFSKLGATSLAELRRIAPAHSETTRILVLLDGYAGFAAAFERVSGGELLDLLPRLVTDGRSVGVHFAITGDRRGAVSAALAGNISRRIVLRQSSADEYSMLGLSIRDVDVDAPAGRALVDGLEVQIALVGPHAAGPGLQTSLTLVAEDLTTRYGARVAPLTTLPDLVPMDSLPVSADPRRPVIGLWDESLEPAALDLDRANLLIAGPIRSGRTTALTTIAQAIYSASPLTPLLFISGRRRELIDLLPWSNVAVGEEETVPLLEALIDQLDHPSAEEPAFLLIDDLTDLVEAPGSQVDVLLTRIVKMSRDQPLRLIATGEAGLLRRAFGGVAAELRKERNGILLQPDLDSDGDLFGQRLPRPSHPRFPPGRGFAVHAGSVDLLQVATSAVR